MEESKRTTLFCTKPLRDGRTVLFRTTEAADAEQLLALGKEIGAETDFLRVDENGFGDDAAREREWIENANRYERGGSFVGFVDGEPACLFGFEIDPNPRMNHSAEIGVCVKRAYWGIGIGPAIMETLIDVTKKRGDIQKLDLALRSDNLRAKALYERFGFKSAGIIPARFLIRGKYYDEERMYLFLKENP